MSLVPDNLTPKDDSGSESFSRFCYQAFIALPFCVDCATDGSEIESIYMEYFEDLALQTAAGWRFVQIKTKDQELGPWTLTELTGANGALRSLLRTHQTVGDMECTLEAHLEGAIKRNDLLETLMTKDPSSLPQCVERVSDRLNISASVAEDFIDRVRIVPRMPPRDLIEDNTKQYLFRIAAGNAGSEVQAVHDSLLFHIYEAMSATRTGAEFPMSILNPDLLTDEQRLRVEAKRLTREKLKEIIAPLQVPSRRLIQRYEDSSDGPPTKLEMKLIAGGAPDSTIDHAKMLRANASVKKYEVIASKGNDELLREMRLRLSVLADAQISRFHSEDRPAVGAWAAIQHELGIQSSVIDPDSIFGRDPFLLLGEVCELTDLCELDWGSTRED